MKTILLHFIKLYQRFISPLKTPSCRFYPTCSHYSFDSITHHGVLIGSLYSIKRILRCHPFSEGGIDIPSKRSIS